MTKLCKDCGETKEANYSHIAKSGAKVYRDEKGRLWKGQVCCDCQSKERARARKYIEEKKKSETLSED